MPVVVQGGNTGLVGGASQTRTRATGLPVLLLTTRLTELGRAYRLCPGR